MVMIMIRHVKTKYTAVGRREIILFFNLYLLEECLGTVLDSAIVTSYFNVYDWLVSIHVGLVLAMAWCLMANGFLAFQLWEDGTRKSTLGIYCSTAIMWGVGFVSAAATFKEWVSAFSPTKQTGLYVVHMIAPAGLILIWLVSQVWLVWRKLCILWPLGDLCFASGFYICGLVLMLAVGPEICESAKHYVDGMFFGVLCILLAVMMVYKYWDDITKADLEFSASSQLDSWTVKDPVLSGFETPASYDAKYPSSF